MVAATPPALSCSPFVHYHDACGGSYWLNPSASLPDCYLLECSMEGFVLISTGFWSIVPPLLALVLALVTKEVYSSLALGVLSGLVIYQFSLNGVGFGQFLDAFAMLPRMFAEQIGGNGALILFLALLGALTVVIAIAGGSRAYAQWVTAHVKNERIAQMLTAVLGVLIFVDDYFNCLTVGAVMRPILDRFKVSREKLAWIIDSMAAPVCIIAPVSSWAVAVGGYLGEDGFNTFVASIPYNLYALLTIYFVILLIVTGWDFGLMLKAERVCKGLAQSERIPRSGTVMDAVSSMRLHGKADEDLEGRVQVPSVVTEESDIDGAAEEELRTYKGLAISECGRVSDLIIPLVVLIVFSVIGMLYMGGFFEGVAFSVAIGEDPVSGLCIGACVALLVAAAMFLPRRLMTLDRFVEGLSEGVRSMVGAIMILVLAWSLGSLCRYMLGTGEFVAGVVTGSGAPMSMLPVLISVVAAFISFAMGTSWGTMALLLPIVLGLFQPSDPLYLAAIGSTLAGAVFGDHISPISDTTILSSTGAQCNHLRHVSTQIPYAGLVMACGLVGYAGIGVTASPWLALAVCLVLVTALTCALHRVALRRG